MKKTFLTLLGVMGMVAASQAAPIFQYNDSDFLLGIQTNGGTFTGTSGRGIYDLVINLTGFQSGTSIASEMTTTYGAGWSNNVSAFSYGLIGGISASPTNLSFGYTNSAYNNTNVVKATYGVGAGGTVAGTYAGTITDMTGLAGSLNDTNISTSAGNSQAVYQNSGTANNWGSFTTLGNSANSVEFDGFNATTWNQVFGNALGLSVWATGDNNIVKKYGTVNLTSAGVLTVAIPEPKSYGLMAVAALLGSIVVIRRRMTRLS